MSQPVSAATPLAAAPPGAVPLPGETQWFREEVHPHHGQLKSYLRKQFPTVRDVDDVVQESYLRLLKVRQTRPIQSVKAFLFGIANHLAIDVIRRDKRSAARLGMEDDHSLSVLDDKPDAAEIASIKQEVAFLAEAIHALPRRCREVMILRKFEHLSHQEIAARLGISVSTVEAQVNRGMRLLTSFFRGKGVAVGSRGSRP
jgi:RNA polymerase sigma factor (sigma-70 family)